MNLQLTAIRTYFGIYAVLAPKKAAPGKVLLFSKKYARKIFVHAKPIFFQQHGTVKLIMILGNLIVISLEMNRIRSFF